METISMPILGIVIIKSNTPVKKPKPAKKIVKFTGVLETSIRKMYKDEMVASKKAYKKKKLAIRMEKRQQQALEMAASMFRRAERRARADLKTNL